VLVSEHEDRYQRVIIRFLSNVPTSTLPLTAKRRREVPKVPERPVNVARRYVSYLGGILLFASLAIVGVRTANVRLREAVTTYRSSARLVPQDIEKAAIYIKSRVPPEEPILVVTDNLDGWVNGIWQRALYPSPVLLFYRRDLGSQMLREYRTTNRLVYAVAIGNPPPDPGFVWKKAVPRMNQSVVFGEIEP
jgi:hypothetical protein